MKKQSKTSFLKNYYSREKHSRAENAIYKKIMQEFYNEYKTAYHAAKIKFRARTAERYSFAGFKSAFKMEFQYEDKTASQIAKSMSKMDIFQELSNYSYRQKYKNFKENYKKILDKQVGLTAAEELIKNYYEKNFAGRRGTPSTDEIIDLVNYFERLGFEHNAFDS